MDDGFLISTAVLSILISVIFVAAGALGKKYWIASIGICLVIGSGVYLYVLVAN